MPAICLDLRHVHPSGRVARPKRNHNWRVVHGYAGVVLGECGLDQHGRMHGAQEHAVWINGDGDHALRDDRADLIFRQANCAALLRPRRSCSPCMMASAKETVRRTTVGSASSVASTAKSGADKAMHDALDARSPAPFTATRVS